MTKKYRLLKTMAVVYKVMAWVSLVFGMSLSIFALVASSLVSQQLGTAAPAGGGFVAFTVLILYTLISFGSFYAMGEVINLLFDIDEQTRGARERETMRPAA